MTPEEPHTCEVRCADVHPVQCRVALRASSNRALTDRVRAHGASVHGFTPVWYSRERMAEIAAITEASPMPVPR
jgi:predicted N-formylglutamate amidohydrolase